MKIRTEKIGITLVVKLDGEIDHSCAGEIRERIDRELSLHSIQNLVWDFGNVEFMDSSGIGMLVGRYQRVKERGGKTMIIRPKPQVNKVLEISGIKKIISCE